MAVRLKRCPFCGGKAKAMYHGSLIKCLQCGITVGLSGTGNADLDDRLREAWNRRISDEKV